MGRMLKVGGLAAALALMSGCTTTRYIVDSELDHPGGVVGRTADRYGYYPTAGSKKMQIYRAVVTFAFFSKIGQTIIRDEGSADAFVKYMNAVAGDINNLAGHVYADSAGTSACGTVSASCENYQQLFETDLPPLEEHLLRLGVAALPKEDATDFLKAATKGNVFSAAIALWNLAKNSVAAGHNVAAIRRSEREVLASIVRADTCASAPAGSVCVSSVTDALSAIPRQDNGRRQVDNVGAIGDKITKENLEPLYLLIRQACWQLPLGVTGGNFADVRAERLRDCQALKFDPVTNARYRLESQRNDVVPAGGVGGGGSAAPAATPGANPAPGGNG